jgi:molybdopterin-binding protein
MIEPVGKARGSCGAVALECMAHDTVWGLGAGPVNLSKIWGCVLPAPYTPRRPAKLPPMRLIGLAVIFALSFLAPLSVEAQPAGTVPRAGWLSTYSGSDPQAQRSLDFFRQTLGELGHVKGQSVAIEYRWAESLEPTATAEILRVISSSPTDLGPVFQSVAVVVDCGFPLVAALTPRSVRELALVPGVNVTAVFEASAAHLIPNR